MFEEIGIPLIAVIFNFIGGCIRYIFINIFNYVLNRKIYSFKECLYGIKNKKAKIEKTDHFVVNSIIGASFFILVASFIIKYNL